MDNHIIKSFWYSNEFNIFKFIGDISDKCVTRTIIDKCLPGEIKRIIKIQFELQISIDYDNYIKEGRTSDIFINSHGYIHQGLFEEKFIKEFDGLIVPDLQRHTFEKFTKSGYGESVTRRIRNYLISIGLNPIKSKSGEYSCNITFEFNEKTIQEFRISMIGSLKDKIISKGLTYEIDSILNLICKKLQDDLIQFNTNRIQLDEKLLGPSMVPNNFWNKIIEFSESRDQIEIIKITQNESILYLCLLILKLESKIISFYRLGDIYTVELSSEQVPWVDRKGVLYLNKENGETFINTVKVKTLNKKSFRFFEILYDKINTKVSVEYIGNVLDKRIFKEDHVNENREYKATLLKMKNRLGKEISSRIDSDEDWFILYDK